MIGIEKYCMDTTTNLTFCDIRFSDIKKMPLIHIFSIIIIDFSFKFHYKGSNKYH